MTETTQPEKTDEIVGTSETSFVERPDVDLRREPEEDGLKRQRPDDDGSDTLCNNEGIKRAKHNHKDGDLVNHKDDQDDEVATRDLERDFDCESESPKLSKNQQRKLRRKLHWEAKKHEKKFHRKEKRAEKKERARKEREAEIAAAAAEGREPVLEDITKRQPRPDAIHVPIAIIIDCQYEKYMMDKELVSLSSQVTRCYSDNKNAKFPVHMFVSSYGGKMQERYEKVLNNQHTGWKNVHFTEGDFVSAAAEAQKLMASSGEEQKIELLEQGKEGDSISLTKTDDPKKLKKSTPVPEPEADDVDKSIVYLTADSPYTLDRLEPNTSYVIGGIIDKNREKGLCYKIARGKNVRTAKLPIGEFMVMQSRHVLTTNHVMEIMLQWLETGDWGAAFMKVIPTRKGGQLKEDEQEHESTPDGVQDESVKATQGSQPKQDVATANDHEDIPSNTNGQETPNTKGSNKIDEAAS
ncbi:uncharacterized protein F4822DRAFT_352547 [Hypoxylon trugodes]|uniref:uncharacterized protein n=1 Tax=Hypoxylon trugodes TaxID=326681 RepID=UPI002197052B|nr:uncharacterized protein F4822DRAFT_352547 [Hypoxylon trugodes]KAI1385735.1 hypothetical protein F4822DRAFT_352547 [Hypoxylon trugodes]